MDLTIPTCKFVLALVLLALPSLAASKTEDVANRYANARLAEIANRDDIALQGYLKLYRSAPGSEILADRLFASAIRNGDMTTAIRAARAQELLNGGNTETALVLFTNAYMSRNWTMAELAADELSQGGNFTFMSPILRSWVRVAKGESPDLVEADPAIDPFFAFYSTDQRVYLDMASGQIAKAKFGLRSMLMQQGDYVRDLMISGAGIMAAQGDDALASALMRSAVNSESASTASPFGKNRTNRLAPRIGLAALHTRIASALLEQSVNDHGLLLARIASWLAPDSASAHIVLARALRANGLQDDAIAALDRIDPASPYWATALRDKVDWLISDNDLTKAASIVTDARKRAPKSVVVKLMLAQVQQESGQLPQAVETYGALVEDAQARKLSVRQQANYRMLLAAALDQSGNWPAARAELEKILATDPSNGQVLNYLGYSLLEHDSELVRATEMIKRAYEMNPDSSAITDSLGWAYFQQGDLVQALPLLEKAAKASAGDAAINEHLGDAFWAAGRRREARYAWRAAAQTAEDDAAARIADKIDMGPAPGATHR